MASPRKVLFACNSEYGQAQVVLAVATTMLKEPNIEVHLASFLPLEPRVNFLNNVFGQQSKLIQFHPLDGPSMTQGYFRHYSEPPALYHPCGVQGAIRSYQMFPKAVAAYDDGEYARLVESFGAIISEVQPGLIVVDAYLWAALDVCRNSSTKYAVITPTGLWGLISGIQPRAAVMWKYPM